MHIDALLDSLQSRERNIRESAEETLMSAISTQGFLGILLSVANDANAPIQRRQLCLTILKDTIRTRWSQVSQDDMSVIMTELPRMVLDGSKSVRDLCQASLAYATSQIGVKKWPGLFETISLAVLSPSASAENRISVLSLLCLIIEECGGSAFGDSVNEITCLLLQVVASCPDRIVHRKVFSVYCTLLVNLSKDEEISILTSLSFTEWERIVSSLAHSGDVGDVTSVLRDLKELISNEVSLVPSSLVNELMQDAIEWLERSRHSFESLLILSEEAGIDENEETGGLCCLLMRICEFFNSIALNEMYIDSSMPLLRFFKAIGPFLQISILTEQEWILCPGEYVASEEEDFTTAASIRLSFESVVADFCWNPILDSQTRSCLLAASEQMVAEGLSARAQENAEWWRLVEAGLFMFGLFSIDEKDPGPSAMYLLQSCAMLCCEDTVHVLLRARAFLVLSNMHSLTVERFSNDIETILNISVACMSSPSPVLVFAASRAFTSFVNSVSHADQLITRQNGALEALIGLCCHDTPSDEIVHFTLDALISLLSKLKTTLQISLSQRWIAFLPSLLAQKVDDPIAPDQICELVKISARILHQSGFAALSSKLASQIKPWLRSEAENRLDVALEILNQLVQNAPVPFSPPLVDCVLCVNENKLDAVGPVTSEMVQSILRTCAIRA